MLVDNRHKPLISSSQNFVRTITVTVNVTFQRRQRGDAPKKLLCKVPGSKREEMEVEYIEL
jgi:hypothetical protein